MTKTITNPENGFALICENGGSCEAAEFTFNFDTNIRYLDGFMFKGEGSGKGATININNNQVNTVEIDNIYCIAQDSCKDTTFVTGTNVEIGDIFCYPGTCDGCIITIDNSPSTQGIPCDSSQTLPPVQTQTTPSVTNICAADTRECPDGSFVGRDAANNCDFFLCPPIFMPQQTGTSIPVQTTTSGPIRTIIPMDVQTTTSAPMTTTTTTTAPEQTTLAPGLIIPQAVSAVFCTMDVRQCPDGTFVGRDGSNNCEFYRCPMSKRPLPPIDPFPPQIQPIQPIIPRRQ